MKKILFLVLITFVSCGIPYDGETILTLEARIENANGEPLPNKIVTVSASADYDYSDYGTYSNKSNAFGIVKFDLFSPRNRAFLEFESSDEYLPVSIAFDKSSFEMYHLNLGIIRLFQPNEIENFSITLNPTSGSFNLIRIDVEAISYESYINLTDDIDNSNTALNFFYRLKKNQNFTLNYQLQNNFTGEISSFSIPLTMENSALQYTLSY
jgi:hypothetical protein